MSNIPTKGQVANNQAAAAAASNQAAEDAAVKYFTDNIIDCMNRGESYFAERTRNLSGNVLTRVQTAFAAQGWTITVSNARTGCTVRWS